MISIHNTTKDPYRIYGISHFIQKYGIALSTNTKSGINLVYGESTKKIDKIDIQIAENVMQNDVCGYLKIENGEEEEIPLFEKPIKLDKKGEKLVIFVYKENQYPCITISKDNMITIGFDIFNEVGHILSGYLEPFWKTNNPENKQLMNVPVIDHYEKILFDCLLLASYKSNIQLIYKPFWPNDKKFAVCLTHDVDKVKKTFQYITHTIRHLKNGKICLAFTNLLPLIRRENPYWRFDVIMEMERRLGVKSTFFFLNEQRKFFCSPCEWKLYWGRYDINNPKIVETIKRLDAEGCEIGIHGSYNSYKNMKLLEEEKNILEGIVGKKVHGISQHYCNLDIPETWEYHEKLELAYDSSIGFVNEIGFMYGTCHPFHPLNLKEGRTLSLWELPIIIMDNACAYKSWRDMENIVDIVEKHNGLLLLRWHHVVFNETAFPGRSKTYEKIIDLCKEKNAWITNAYEIAKWCKSR